MIDLTEYAPYIDKALAEKMPCVLATASADGEPDIGPKGSMMVFDKDHLAYWERSQRVHLRNIRENPKVAVWYYNPVEKVRGRFFGTATLYSEGPIRRKILPRVVTPEMEKDVNRTGYAVLIRVDKVIDVTGEVLQEREPEPAQVSAD